MIIQNKKGQQQSVTPEDWEKMEALGFRAGWMVISNDSTLKPKKEIPKAIIDFNQIIKNKKDGSKGSSTIPGDKDVQLDGDRGEGTTV
jgi:hypothetical protein